jgi:mono/diheme cytochrome c family protein
MMKLSLPPAFLFASLAILSISNPLFALSKAESEQAGAVLFRDKGCAYCHGATATGTTRGPSLANVRKKLKAQQIHAQIENGGQKMPSFREALTNDEIEQLVAYLRAKTRPVLPSAPAPAAVSNPGQ